MTKSEFVDQVASRTRALTKSEAGKAVDAVLDDIEEALAARRATSRSPASASSTWPSAARARACNPRTGEPIQIAASKVPRFTAGSGLKKAVNG